jgi:phosphoglycolate phosphatase
VVLFDLDGTLSESEPGIMSSLRRAFEVHDIAPLTPEQERTLLGPPWATSLPPFVGADRVDAVIATYREYYGSTGMFETTCYAGVPDLLDELRARGVRLAVSTSKPETFAVPILERLGLSGYFETVAGDTLDGARGSKALVIDETLYRLGHPDVTRTLMVGDRVHDVEGAAAHGIGTLGAGWGYGTPAELARALAVYGSAAELLGAVRSGEIDAFVA